MSVYHFFIFFVSKEKEQISQENRGHLDTLFFYFMALFLVELKEESN